MAAGKGQVGGTRMGWRIQFADGKWGRREKGVGLGVMEYNGEDW